MIVFYLLYKSKTKNSLCLSKLRLKGGKNHLFTEIHSTLVGRKWNNWYS